MNPFPIVLSSPSGAGKTTIARRVLAVRRDVGYSISCTTRAARADEVDGRDYHFLSTDEFHRRVGAGDFAEWAEVHGRLYGTLRGEISRVLGTGRHVIMDIDVQGARNLSRTFPEAVLIYVLPPSADTMVRRLRSRGTETEEALAGRMRNAIRELGDVDLYGYAVINDDLDRAVAAVGAVIDAETHRVARAPDLAATIQGLVDGLSAELNSISEKVQNAGFHTERSSPSRD